MHDSDQQKTSDSFGRIKEAIVLKIQTTFKNPMKVAESITSMKLSRFKEPEFTVSVNTDADAKNLENRMSEMKYKIMLEIYMKDIRGFDKGLVKVYALISQMVDNRVYTC